MLARMVRDSVIEAHEKQQQIVAEEGGVFVDNTVIELLVSSPVPNDTSPMDEEVGSQAYWLLLPSHPNHSRWLVEITSIHPVVKRCRQEIKYMLTHH